MSLKVLRKSFPLGVDILLLCRQAGSLHRRGLKVSGWGSDSLRSSSIMFKYYVDLSSGSPLVPSSSLYSAPLSAATSLSWRCQGSCTKAILPAVQSREGLGGRVWLGSTPLVLDPGGGGGCFPSNIERKGSYAKPNSSFFQARPFFVLCPHETLSRRLGLLRKPAFESDYE